MVITKRSLLGVCFHDEPLDFLEGTVEYPRPFPDPGISVVLDLDLRVHEPLDGFDLLVGYRYGDVAAGCPENLDHAGRLQNIQPCLVVRRGQLHEQVAREHGQLDLFSSVLPPAPYLDFRQKGMNRFQAQAIEDSAFVATSRVNGIPGHQSSTPGMHADLRRAERDCPGLSAAGEPCV